MVMVTSADAAPTLQMAKAFTEYNTLLDRQIAEWDSLRDTALPALNLKLQQRQLPTIK